MKFKEQLRIIEEALLKPMSIERVKELDEEKIKIIIDKIKKNAILNEDGSYDVDDDVDLSEMNLTELPIVFDKVSGDFICYYNKLTSLEGSPREVGGDFICYENQLPSLEGAPREVAGSFSCENNNLTSLDNMPKIIGKHCFVRGNSTNFNEDDVSTRCKVGGEIFV